MPPSLSPLWGNSGFGLLLLHQMHFYRNKCIRVASCHCKRRPRLIEANKYGISFPRGRLAQLVRARH